MICTFGDLTDVTWWRRARPADASGRRLGRSVARRAAGGSLGRAARSRRTGSSRARPSSRHGPQIVDMLRERGDLLADPKPITHAVKFYEKGDRPLEIVTTRQWYLRNGGRDIELAPDAARAGPRAAAGIRRLHAGALRGLGRGAERRLAREPAAVLRCAVPRLVPASTPTANPTTSTPSSRPRTAARRPVERRRPTGTPRTQRGQPGGFVADPDVMDTWATSSLTPQIVCGWGDDADLFARTFPMDLRPQAHEIIRTWLFSTVVRAHFEFGGLPWRDTPRSSGWILDPDRKKMSKSKGNVVTPMALLEQYGSDAVRLLGGERAPRHRHRVRRGSDEGRPPARDQDPRRVQVRARRDRRRALRASTPSTAPLDRALLARARRPRRRVNRRVRGLRLRPHART